MDRAGALSDHFGLGEQPLQVALFAVTARVAAHERRFDAFRHAANHARRLIAQIDRLAPWLQIQARLGLARAHLEIGEPRDARQLVKEASALRIRLPDAVALAREIDALAAQVREAKRAATSLIAPLTTAELRVLAYLPTHLTYQAIAEDLLVSRNTVKSQTIAIYDTTGYYGWDVAPGCWYLRVSAPGYEAMTSPVVGVPTAVTDLDLALQPLPVVGDVPGAPGSVTAAGAKLAASVSFAAPASDGGQPISAYTVSAAPGGATCTALPPATSCVVSGLTEATSYTFTVRATNIIGQGAASAPSNAVVPWAGSAFHPVVPSRVLDSRGPNGGWNAALAAGTPKNLKVTGLGGPSEVPQTASAVIMNVTATASTLGSFVSVWPAGLAKPVASNLNFAAGQTIPNLVTVKIGTGGNVSFGTALGSVHLIADVVGYFDDGTAAGDLFTGVTPERILDTRGPTGTGAAVAQGTPRALDVRGTVVVPDTATTVVANVTVTGGSAGSFLSVWPSGVPQPTSSNLNFGAGQTIPNLVVIKIGADGKINIANAVGSVHVIVDVVGYFDPTGGARFHAVDPTRMLDSRLGVGLSGVFAQGISRPLPVAGAAGSGVRADATAMVANVTATEGTAGSFVTLYPDGVARPTSSNLNFAPGETIPNLTMVKIGQQGRVDLYNHVGATHLIADVVGYYAPT